MNTKKDMIVGLQHIGLPTPDVQKTIDFYTMFGFNVIWKNGRQSCDWVAFLKNGSCVIETYFAKSPALCNGAVDHIALDVTDIDSVYSYVNSVGCEAIEGKITYLPFFTNGVKYFTILDPNHEKLEFNQIL